jgi:transglutaminase-like putative cysteine protease
VRVRLLTASLLVLCAAALQGGADQAPDPKLDPDLPYLGRRSKPVTYQVDLSFVVTPPYKAKVLKIWLPIPPSDAAQQVTGRELRTFPMQVEPRLGKDKVFGNEFAYFEFANPQGAQIIRHRFQVKAWEMTWNVDPKKVAKVGRWPDGFQRYLRSEQRVVVDERFQKLAGEIVPRARGPAEDLAAVMDWIDRHLTYDHVNCSLEASAVHALEKRAGHCSDYHGLCASLGRALGYPTRVVYGIHPFPKNSPSHCKVEAFLPPYGWVPFDLSETQLLIGRIQKDTTLDAKQKEALARAAKERLLHGFRDNTWFLQTRGTDYDLAPPAGKRVPVVRTIYAEADGVALPDPDPANPKQREFGWMTVHHYVPDRAVTSPFQDWKSLQR